MDERAELIVYLQKNVQVFFEKYIKSCLFVLDEEFSNVQPRYYEDICVFEKIRCFLVYTMLNFDTI